MKILFIDEHFTQSFISGASMVAYNNYFMMKDRGHECYFYATDIKPLLEEQHINKLFPKSHIYQKNIIDSLIYRINCLFNFTAKKNLEKVIEEIKPDIIHLHSSVELSYSVILAIKKYKIPYIITIHDAGFVCPVMGTREQKCTLCSDSPCNCIKKKCSRNSYFNSIYVACRFWLAKNLLKIYPPEKIISPSNALKNYILSTKFSMGIPVEVFQNTLDKDFENVQPNYNNDDYFLFAGSLYDAKGVDILLRAIKESGAVNTDFHIVGEGTAEAESRYKNFVKENNLSNVKFIGKLNRKELIKEYQNCIAVIVPSICFDIFGMVNIEAFINGKPVIASDIGGLSEIVGNNKTGLIFKPSDVQQLKECILKYMKNNNLVTEHGKNAYEKAVELYTSKNVSQILENLYLEVIK